MTPDEKFAFARAFPVHVGVDTGTFFHLLIARGPEGRSAPPPLPPRARALLVR